MKAGEGMSRQVSGRRSGRDGNRTILKRTLLLMGIFGVLTFLILIGRLWYLQVIRHDALQERAIAQQTSEQPVTAQRGTIYDNQGNVLAISSTVYDVILSPKAVEEKQEASKQSGTEVQNLVSQGLAGILEDVDAKTILEKCGDKKSQYKKIATKVEGETEESLRKFISDNELAECIYLTPTTKRYYPYSDMAAQVIGFTNESGGAYGVESQFNEYLAGKAGLVVTATNGRGTDLLNFFQDYYDAESGDDVHLTRDSTIQSYCQKYLDQGVEEYDVRKGGCIIAMDCNSGAILGMASSPNYDLNNYSKIRDSTLKAKIKGKKMDKGEARLEMWRNKALNDTYEPGSTFKSVVLASALEEGVITTEDHFYCAGYVHMGGYRIRCSSRGGHGQQTLAEAVGHSCNPAFIQIGQKLGEEKFYSYLEAFGLTDKTGIDLPGEGDSVIWKEKDFGSTNLATASFGQRFTITPIQLITAVSAVVNGGYLYQPHVVSSVVDREGNTVYEADTAPVRQVVSEATSRTCAELLEGVVSSYTGQNAYQPGYRIGGKTGTSQTLVKDEYIASFVGFAPANDPQVIVQVGFNSPKVEAKGSNTSTTGYNISGGRMAAPIAGQLLADILDYQGFEKEYTANDLSGSNVSVPALIGSTEKNASKALNSKDLTYRKVGNGDKVTDQIPVSGTYIPSGSRVILYMGGEAPEETITMPDLSGMTPDVVKDTLNNLGLYMRASGASGNYTSNTVAYQQSVQAGDQVTRGEVIRVTFSNQSIEDNDSDALE